MKGLPFLVALEMGGLFFIQRLFAAMYLAVASMGFANAFRLSNDICKRQSFDIV